jgi:hypothetical protein
MQDKTVVEDVADLMRQKIDLAALCGEMLATLTLPANAVAEKLGGCAAELLVSWQKKFDAITRGTHVRDA